MYSLHRIDEKLLTYLNYKNGFFIECGANDGVTQSNTLLLEKNFGWTGLLVEPGVKNYQKCKNIRTNSMVENYALVSSSYKNIFIKGNFDNESHNGLMNSVNVTPSYFNEEMIFFQNKFKLENRSPVTETPCCTLQYLLDKHDIKNVDFFSLDVEGYEIEVLNGIDFTKVRPKYILIETTSSQYYSTVVDEYMISKNYKFIERISINDALYMDT